MFFRHLIVISSLLLAVGCSFKKPDQQGSGSTSSFDVQGLSLQNQAESRTDAFGLPSEKILTWRACLFEKATTQRIRQQPFRVETFTDRKVLVSGSTDGDGCLNWDEVVQYNSLAPLNVVPNIVWIVGEGGEFRLDYGIVPWRKSSDVYVDLRGRPASQQLLTAVVSYEERSDALLGQGRFAPGANLGDLFSNLEITKFETEIPETPVVGAKGPVRVSDFIFHGVAKQRTFGGGTTDLPPLQKGEMRVNLSLFEYSATGRQPDLVFHLDNIHGRWASGKLLVQVPIDFQDRLKRGAELGEDSLFKVVYSMSAEDASLLPAAGEFTIPQRVGKSSGTPTEWRPEAATRMVKEAGIRLTPLPRGPGVKPASHLIPLRPWGVAYRGFAGFNPFTWEYSVEALVTLCLGDAYSKGKIGSYNFRAQLSASANPDFDTAGSTPKTIQGCLSWPETLKFPLAAPETYFKRWISVRVEDGPYRGEVISIPAEICPWQKGELFYHDSFGSGVPARENPTTEVATLNLKDVEYEFEGREYEVINPALDLIQHRRYKFYFKPSLARGFTFDDRDPDKLPKGTKIAVKGVLVESSRGEPGGLSALEVSEKWVGSFETTGVVDDDGTTVVEGVIPVSFLDEPRLDSRTHLVLEVSAEPLGKGIKGTIPQSAVIAGLMKTGEDDLGRLKLDKASKLAVALERAPGVDELVDRPYIDHSAGNPRDAKSFYLARKWSKSPLKMLVEHWEKYSEVVRVSVKEGDWEDALSLKRAEGKYGLVNLETGLEAILAAEQGHLPWLFAPEQGRRAALSQWSETFCDLLEGAGTVEVARCRNSPHHYFHISRYDVTEKVLDPKAILSKKLVQLNKVQATFGREMVTAKKLTAGDRTLDEFLLAGVLAKVGAGAFGNEVSAMTGYNRKEDRFMLTEASRADEEKIKVESRNELVLNEETKTFDLALAIRRCVFVRPQAATLISWTVPAFAFCGKETEESAYQETWSLWRDRTVVNGNGSSNHKDLWERGWAKLIRGLGALLQFRVTIQNSARGFKFDKVEPLKNGPHTLVAANFLDPKSRRRFDTDSAVFQGVTRYEEAVPSRWPDVEIEAYSRRCMNKALSGLIGDIRRQVKDSYRYCRCIFETASQEWSFEDYTADAKGKKAQLESLGTGLRCEATMKGGK